MSVITVPVARVFVPLLSNDFRYYGAHGGRGSGKSHFFAGRVVDLVGLGLWHLYGFRKLWVLHLP